MNVPFDQIRDFIQYIPFMSLMNKPHEAEGPSMWKHPLTVRLMEAAIIATIVMYGTVQSAEVKMSHIYLQVQEIKQELHEIKHQLRLVEQEQWRRDGMNKLNFATWGK